MSTPHASVMSCTRHAQLQAQAGGAPGQPDIYQMLQEAHAAAADEARLMAAHARQGASLAKVPLLE